MCRWKRRADRWRYVWHTFFLILFTYSLFCIQTCAQEVTVEQTRLCDEDEYLLLCSGCCYAEIFDCDGTYVGRCRTWMDEFLGAGTAKKTDLLCYRGEDCWSVYSMAELKNILEFPADRFYVTTEESVCLVQDYQTGTMRLYDNHGAMLFGEQNERWVGENSGYSEVLALENGYLITFRSYDETEGDGQTDLFWVSRDGFEVRKLNNPELLRQWENGNVLTFGKYLLVYDWDANDGYICDQEGTVLLSGVNGWIGDACWDSYAMVQRQQRIVWCRENDVWRVYDETLQQLAEVPYNEELSLAFSDRFVTGARYEELNGNVCTGFADYNNERKVPYARVDGGFLVYDGKQTGFVAGEAEDELFAVNDFCVREGGFNSQEQWAERVIDRDTGTVLQECVGWEGEWTDFMLGKDCYVASGYQDGQTMYRVVGSGGEILLDGKPGNCTPWKNGLLVLKRGIYNGIADQDGRWLVRTIPNWRE